MKRIPLVAAFLTLQACFTFALVQSRYGSPQSVTQPVVEQTIDAMVEPKSEPHIILFKEGHWVPRDEVRQVPHFEPVDESPTVETPSEPRQSELVPANQYVKPDFIQEFIQTLEVKKGCPCSPAPRRTLMDRIIDR